MEKQVKRFLHTNPTEIEYYSLPKENLITLKEYLLSRKVRKHLLRKKDIDLIQDELDEIENVGRNIYRDALKSVSSISNNFQIYYPPILD